MFQQPIGAGRSLLQELMRLTGYHNVQQHEHSGHLLLNHFHLSVRAHTKKKVETKELLHNYIQVLQNGWNEYRSRLSTNRVTSTKQISITLSKTNVLYVSLQLVLHYKLFQRYFLLEDWNLIQNHIDSQLSLNPKLIAPSI